MSATRKNTQLKRTFGQWAGDSWTTLTSLVIALVAGTESAWAGARLLMQAGSKWYEGVGITGSLDLMMIIAAVRMRRKGIHAVQVRISRYAMWYGLAMSACTNVLSALVYKGILDIAQVGPWITVAYSPVVVITLWFVVEMLTHQGNSAAERAFPLVKPAKSAPKPDSECTPAQLAKRQADRARRAAKREAKALQSA